MRDIFELQPHPVNHEEGLDRLCSDEEWPRRTQHPRLFWYTADIIFENDHIWDFSAHFWK